MANHSGRRVGTPVVVNRRRDPLLSALLQERYGAVETAPRRAPVTPHEAAAHRQEAAAVLSPRTKAVPSRPATMLGEWAIHPGRACAGADTELFFPPSYHTPTADAVKAVCRRCPVRDQCREYAITAQPPVEGIWGGTTPEARRQIRLERHRDEGAR